MARPKMAEKLLTGTLNIKLKLNQRTNGPVNAHLISEPHLSTKYKNN